MEELWGQKLSLGNSIDLGKKSITIQVKKGDLIGFSVSAPNDRDQSELEWPSILQYSNGRRFNSADNPKLTQGPVWYYYLHATGTGYMDPLDEMVEPGPVTGLKEKRRAPVGYRANWEAPTLGASVFGPKNSFNLIRAWRAPASGKVTLLGEAKVTSGSEVKLRIVRINKRTDYPSQFSINDAWTLQKGTARQINAGGRPAARLDLTLTRESLRAQLHVVAYPGTSVMRQWLDFENTGKSTQTLQSPTPFSMALNGQDLTSMTRHILYGGTSRPNQGVLSSTSITLPYHQALLGEKTDNYVSWMALQHKTGSQDGWYLALDYLGTWLMSLDNEAQKAALFTVAMPTLANYSLTPGERLELPLITLGVFQKDLEDMGQRVYDWQYEYMWDFTNPDFYAQTKWGPAWFPCTRNLQEQFTARLAKLDMDADLMRTVGYTLLWDDAGWSKYPTWPVPDNYGSVFKPTHEGPDFSQTLDYLRKMDMKWLAWFGAPPQEGIMNSKAGAWGDYQYRTDGVGRFTFESDKVLRRGVKEFLTLHPRCSFHTCDGGSRYAHQFEIQRLADVNYMSDLGAGPEMNYYFSYLELPDKWVDLRDPEPGLVPLAGYHAATARSTLSMVPGWGGFATPEAQEQLRLNAELYRFFLQEGVVGRWSYTFHPAITGDVPTFYLQRTNHARTKACIVLKHQAKGEITIRPAGLLPENKYIVGFDSTRDTTTRTGADLMANGITIKKQSPGEMVYLNMPNRPGSGFDKTTPQAPGRVLLRRELNIGHTGVGIYWSAVPEDHWISYYEIERNGKLLGKISTGAYYFDWSPEADMKAVYSVRTVDGNRNTSTWTDSSGVVDGDPYTISALGGLFPEWGRDGWQAETMTDGSVFKNMKFIAPAKTPGGDFGGTPNQPGGVEGYWEGAGTARVGRGWQQTSKDAACVRTWIAPQPGRIRVVGRAMKEFYHQDKGSELRVRILLNKRQIWPKENWAKVSLNDLIGATHDLALKVKAGDALRFVLDRSANPESDILAWMPQIVYSEKIKRGHQSIVRILCGAEEKYKDHNGNLWSRDRFFKGGAAMNNNVRIQDVTPTDQDQALYQAGRHGRDFSYKIPVKPGLYSIRLKFAEPEYEWSFQRPMNVDINGHRVLTDYDICGAAKGWRKAHERTFRHLVPDADGNLNLRFTAGEMPIAGAQPDAMVQAIEILPEVPAKPQRIDVGSPTPFIDWAGALWQGDKVEGANSVIQSNTPVKQASPTIYDQPLYQTARTGRKIEITAKALPGHYTVHLKFAEMWLKETGGRPMNIEINGHRYWENYDPSTAANMINMGADLRIDAVTPDNKGRINVIITSAGKNDAILQGLEIK